MPVHLVKIHNLQRCDPVVCKCLTSGEFAVNKSGIPFSDLFTDQAQEQEIKHPKGQGGINGTSQTKIHWIKGYTKPNVSKFVKNH